MVSDFDVAAAALGRDGDGPAAFKGFAAADADRVGADVAGGHDRDALAAADAIDGGLDRLEVVGARVEVCRSSGRREGVS
ncbi:hypothetical protein BM1_02660 [Bipolaris maydis]|nr:hypothetical protein BM1_02660 [Bipolaris maydis]